MTPRSPILLLSFALVLPGAAQEPAPEQRVAAGIVAYRAGRHDAARVEFAAAAAAFGERCPPHVAVDWALAALRTGRPSEAEAAARSLLGSDDAAVRADAEFLLASAAFQHGERAEAAAQLQDPEPMAWPAAERAFDLAHRGFGRAAMLRPEWPEARRNAERAWRRLSEVRRLRAEAEQKGAPDRREKQPPPPPPSRPPDQPPEEAAPGLATTALSPAEVGRLLQRVQQQERDKQAVRRLAQRAAAAPGERDW